MSTKADHALGRNWGRLMAAAQEGDADAYSALLSELACWLREYLSRRLPPAMTDDAVRDALLAIHEMRHTYDPKRPFDPWLAAIARSKWIDHLRSLKFQAAECLDEDIGMQDRGASVIAGSTLQRLLAQLNPHQAEAIRLVKLKGYSVEEASDATGQSMLLMKVNIHRGIKRLADIIEASDNVNRFPRRSSRPGAGPDSTAQRARALATQLFRRALSPRSQKVTCHD